MYLNLALHQACAFPLSAVNPAIDPARQLARRLDGVLSLMNFKRDIKLRVILLYIPSTSDLQAHQSHLISSHLKTNQPPIIFL